MNKNRTADDWVIHPHHIFPRHEGFSAANESSVLIDDDAVSEYHVRVRSSPKGLLHGRERAGQVLFIAIQVGQNLPLRSPETSVDRIIHPVVLFDERFNSLIPG